MIKEEALFVRRSGASEALECAFVWRGLPDGADTPLPLSRYSWSDSGKTLLDRVHRLAKGTGHPEGKQLPYADLRAAIQARVPGLVLLHDRILPYGDGVALFATDAKEADVQRAANRTVAAWCQLTLRPWAERLGVDAGDIEMVEKHAERLALFEAIPFPDIALEWQVPDALISDFHEYSDYLLAIAATSLDGAQLFPGLGPVHRIIDREYGNSVSFETWPSPGARGDDLFSMFAELSVETRPSSRLPFLVVRAGKRIWCREFPSPGQLYGRKRISVRAVVRGERTHAVTLSVGLAAGSPTDRLDAMIFEVGRASGESIGGDLVELVKSRGKLPDLFVGVPFRYGYRPTPRIESGVTLQDQVDLTNAIAAKLGPYGFHQSRIRAINAVAGAPTEFHVQANLHNLITHHFGRVSEEDVPGRIEELFGEPEKKSKGPDRPARTVDLQPMVEANRERLDRAFGAGAQIDLVFVCRREQEDRIFRSVVGLLFGDRVNVVRHVLPDGTHGARKALDGEKSTRSARAALRKSAWLSLAEIIRTELPGSPVIVQAAKQYEGGEDDGVNKDVGRNTLATHAGCSVQYLLPPSTGQAAEYMHRVQAALYDLLFAHAGLGPVPKKVVEATFGEGRRPCSIVGISIISQAASRGGRPTGADLAVATKVDVETGRISARIGYCKGEAFDTGKFGPLSATLVRVAGAGVTSLGNKRAERRTGFQLFVKDVVDDVASDDPNALVILESTTANSLWPWLTDENISSEIYFHDRTAPAPEAWRHLRFVRVREKVAGRLAALKQRFWEPVTRDGIERPGGAEEQLYATAVETLVESLSEGNAKARHYLCAHGFGIRNRGARGQSSFRAKTGFVRAGAKTPKRKSQIGKVLFKRGTVPWWDKPSQIPATLEITVLPSQSDDDEDAIATLILALRNGYSHTVDGTSLPAPLSFKSKILDYLDRYGTASQSEEADAADEDRDDLEPLEESVDPVVGYGETRRWFERSEDFGVDDIPDSESDHYHDARPAPFVTRNQLPKLPAFDTSGRDRVSITLQETPQMHNLKDGLDDEVHLHSNEAAENALLAALRNPTARLPSFVDEAFLASTMHFVRSDIRRMHEERAWIRAITGFAWPQERPSVEEMPSIYVDALQYPAFAIAVQHQFFHDDYARGFPKSEIVRQYLDMSKKIIASKPMERAETHLSVLRALHVFANGGDRHVVFAELISLPGSAAWRAPCSEAMDGLEKLEKRRDEIAEIGQYLRSVVGPFTNFAEGKRTIGDVFESVVIPLALKLPVPAELSGAPEATKEVLHVPFADEEYAKGAREEPPSAETLRATSRGVNEERGAIELSWRQQSSALKEISDESIALGPNGSTLARLRELLNVLEVLHTRAVLLFPPKRSTDALVADLRELIGKISAALQSHIGETLNADEISASLSDIGLDVEAEYHVEAEALASEASSQFSKSEAIAAEIVQIEAELPMKVARERTAPLVELREQHLKDALASAGSSVGTLVAGTPAAVAAAELEVSPLASVPPQVIDQSIAVATVESEEEIPYLPVEDGSLAEDLAEVDLAPLERCLTVSEVVPEDPLRNDVVRCLDDLFIAGEFGLAFHLLTAAEETLPATDFIYSKAELRLASAAGRSTGLSGQDLQSLAEARSQALAVAQELSDLNDGRSIARRVTLLAGAIPPALFRSDDMSAVSLVENIGGKGATSHYHQLVSAVEENRKRGFPVTAANLAAVEAHSHESKLVDDAVAEIKATLEGFRSSRFKFQLGEKIKYAITQPNGILGRLLSGIDGSTHVTVKEIGQELKNRDAIMLHLSRVASDIGDGQEIDGSARERLVGILSQIGQQCMDLSESMDSFNALRRSAGRLDIIKRLRDLALTGVETVLAHGHASSGDVLIDAGNANARAILTLLQGTLQGKVGLDRDMAPLAVSLHGPLLFLPKLTWTGAWTPSPYDAEVILQEIMSVSVPLFGKTPSASVERAFEARRLESAFVPAHMLLNIARWFGVSQAKIEEMRAKLDADKEVKKGNVKTRLHAADRMIDRMRRMAIGSLEQSARLKETLSTVNPESLPVELPPNFLPESVSGDRVEDFNSALSRIRAVEVEAQREFEKFTSSYAAQIAALDKDGKLDPETGRELKNLLDRLEFTTLADWLNMLRTGNVRKPLLPSGTINWRLKQFREVLPSLSSVDLLQVARAVESGKSLGPIDYGHLDEDRRDEGARIVRLFIELKRAVKQGTAAQAPSKLTEAVSSLFYEVSSPIVDQVLTRSRQQIFVCDVKVALPPTDPTSLVLPEFGSLTQGSWRICVVASTIAQSDLLTLGEGAGSRGIIVYVLGVLNSEKRNQLRVELSKRQRAMLIVDEALIAVAMADKEDRRRAMIEIAQGYSGADPYKDHAKAAVPAEMFKGRAVERSEIVKPLGSYVVYGGRRLGKTALLQQIHASQPPNAIFAYVDLEMVADSSDAFERMARKIGEGVMDGSVRTDQEFSAAISTWLEADERRRILLLIDEADIFVRQETESGFRCIKTMLQLMAETKNRFKFVLAGLHNVSRSLRTENSPLVQISNNALQIGPLLNGDVDDAEFLVRGPLAAMGYEFDSREDVWRILSFTNYYPVLIQVFCQELLRLIHGQVQQTSKIPTSISTNLVERAFRSSDVRGKLFLTFEKTIASIEGRYELITYILASRELMERDSGMAAEGTTAAEVAEKAMDYWPDAFRRGSDPAELEYLLEEMEGFGIARRTPSGRFALRSRSLLELMAYNEEDLNRKLESFRNMRAPPDPFDPKNFRRAIGKAPKRQSGELRISPLTDGQEADLLSPIRGSGVAVVFGTRCAGIHHVEDTLSDARRVKDGSISLDVRSFATKKDMLDEAKRPAKGNGLRVLVVSSRSPWTPDWVVEAERLGRRRKEDLHVIFVGEPKHARSWAGDDTIAKRALPQIKIVKLRPWSRSFLGTRVDAIQLPGDLVDRIYEKTGGWNEIVDPLMTRISDKPGEVSTLVSAASQDAILSPALLTDLGISEDLLGFFKELALYADGSTITTTDFQYLCTSDGRGISSGIVGTYSDLLGILSFPPNQGGEQVHRKVDLNPLVLAVLLRPE